MFFGFQSGEISENERVVKPESNLGKYPLFGCECLLAERVCVCACETEGRRERERVREREMGAFIVGVFF